MTPFETTLRDAIGHEGPITVERYMSLCLQHYYGTRDPLGAGGDFTTAPEISQVFGELIGLWMLEVWQAQGRPAPLRLVELGPGRGTLMADMLRAARLVPEFLTVSSVHLVETSPALRKRQEQILASTGAAISWHDRIEEIPEGPAVVIANEFFDSLPVRQFIAAERGWHERLVGLGEDGLVFGLGPEPEPSLGESPAPGSVLEWPAAATDLARTLSRRLAEQGGATLILDYGYWGPRFGDTLQAVKHHAYADPLASPGETDLTVHVDFHRLAQAGAAEGLAIHGIVTQGDFLRSLGIEVRAAALKRRATPAQSEDIDRAVERLTGRGADAMGDLFKVLALSHPDLAVVPGLPRATVAERS